ncbi:hypothetical protein [Embleya hyalina]|uniref:Uncharacterized protein n=1 Tax=Embleya hyalina TaxID=516124 RepID=A0A401Z5L7_9ACTN|nr:hypothetical protein [Embleya hyalina]GCE02143.1 hypothetical protein EHYA_09920 [Embleya hyalina]GCE02664.1 hypothetical protein EHYA_10446 [Embleya hyalina]
MNRKGITRGDAIVILAIVLIFIFSFFKYYEVSATSHGSSNIGSDDGDLLGGGRSESKSWNAWTVDFYPLMPAVVLVPLLALLLLVIGRFTAQPDKPALGLAPRQWAIALGVSGAISGFFAPFGAGGMIGDIVKDSAPSRYSVDSGPTVFAWLMMVAGLVAALFLIIGDRIPSLTSPLFSPVPQQPWGYPPNATGGYPAPLDPNTGLPMAIDPNTGYPLPNATGGYPAPPGYPATGVGTAAPIAGVPAHMPPPDPSGSTAAVAEAAAGTAAPVTGAPVTGAPVTGAPGAVESGTGGRPAAETGPQPPEFAQFWFAVPEARPLAPTEGLSKTPVATLRTGQWYLAVAPHPGGVLVEADGVRGVLSDVSGIQRGE